MVSYQRPEFPAVTFRDAAGEIIEYGRRWQGQLPPEETYSVVTHPERFAPLRTVADALSDYLTTLYEASSNEDPAFAADLMHSRNEVLRAVRITPASADAAPLTFVYTTDPGVRVHAGLLHDFPFPDCGCDACDETVESAADGLEEIVLAVAEGRYQETYTPGVAGPRLAGRWAARPAGGWTARPDSPRPRQEPPQWPPGPRTGYQIIAPDGSFRARAGMVVGGSPADRLAKAKARLEHLPNGWQPWPPRRA